MKKLSILIVCLFIPLSSFAGTGFAGSTLGIAPLFGRSAAVSGTYSTNQKSADILQPGMVYGVSFSRRLSSYYRIEVQGIYTYLIFKKADRPNVLRKQAYVLSGIVFSNNLQLNFRRLTIYVPLGVGIYFWKYTQDGPASDVILYEGEKLHKMSPGFSTGLGFSFKINRHFSVFGDSRYHFILSKDKFFFGNDFTEQGLLLSTAGFRFWF
ncbi:hypothetical protein BMS3Abin05_02071 [bacterium BMS3Abin05]|nr:hypothetical protein BMS3Abin05_02071 [bacterium BMS3Abin05]GBE27176.1 hypothetical protein BMS3Bbin03_01100 [bacterium BMS3Bbin03]